MTSHGTVRNKIIALVPRYAFDALAEQMERAVVRDSQGTQHTVACEYAGRIAGFGSLVDIERASLKKSLKSTRYEEANRMVMLFASCCPKYHAPSFFTTNSFSSRFLRCPFVIIFRANCKIVFPLGKNCIHFILYQDINWMSRRNRPSRQSFFFTCRWTLPQRYGHLPHTRSFFVGQNGNCNFIPVI